MPETREDFTDTPYRAPDNVNAATVARIWADVLGVDRIGAMDSFFDFAGTSINAISISAKIEREFSITIAPRLIYDIDVLEEFVNSLRIDGDDARDG